MKKDQEEIRQELCRLLSYSAISRVPSYTIIESLHESNYSRYLICFKGDENDEVRAFLYIPKKAGKVPGVLIHHQHNSEYHLGKSEVAGIRGSKFQAFAPTLASKGFALIVPDRITFEDRRANIVGTNTHKDDWIQHYNQFCYRLLNGKVLATKILNDSTLSLNLLANMDCVDSDKLMVIGHSDGGNISLFQSALDERIRYCCASGCLCSYKTKISNQTGISMMLSIPSFTNELEIVDIVKCIAPRNLLFLSADQDKYSIDADDLIRECKLYWKSNEQKLKHYRYQGGHSLDNERFIGIIDWAIKSLQET